MNWTSTTLGKHIDIKHGYAFLGEFFSDSGDYVLLTPGNCYEKGGLKLKGEKELYYIGDFPREYLLKKDDLLIVMTDLVNTAPVLGGAFLIPEDNIYLHNQRLGLVKILNDNKVDKNFLYYLLNSHSYRGQIRGSASGATVKHTAPGRIKKCKIRIPIDLKVQQVIGQILFTYDDLIGINRRRIQLLEDSARLLFREWFVYLHFPGHEKAKIADGVPEGWKKENMNKLVTFKRGVEPGSANYLETYESGSFPFFRVSDLVTRNPSIFVDEQYVNSALLKMNDIVVSLDGSVGIVSMGLEGCYSTGIRKLIIKDKSINRAFLYFLMKSHYIQGVINAYAKGTTIQHAGEAIKRMNPVLPTQNLMDRFDEIVNPVLNEILILLEQNQKFMQARDLLLPRLMSGAIEV